MKPFAVTLIIPFILSSFLSFGQEEKAPNKFIKAYTSFHENPLSLAYGVLNKKGKTHEFQLNRIVSKNEVKDQEKIETKGITLGYEYQLELLLHKPSEGRRLNTFLGVGTNLDIRGEVVIPEDTRFFERRNFITSFDFVLVPRITYNVTKRIFLDLNVTLTLFTIGEIRMKTLNPTFPNGGIVSNNIFSDIDPEAVFRVGMGVRI